MSTMPPPLHSATQWASAIASALAFAWPQLEDGGRWITAQVQTESGGNPTAKSPVGACGLLQLMPATAAEVEVKDPFDPDQNLAGGIRYLRIQFDHLKEIPLEAERLLWAFAAYNGGRGYINKALQQAHLDGESEWWRWDRGRMWLFHRNCMVGGRYPDYGQMFDYVARIRTAHARLAA